jgi:NADH dehydrogenase [ubiquinone] 1 alpha subcomplex assembly factor 7
MSLLDRLKAQIAQDGPIGVPEFFTRCLHDPRDGYYATRPGLRPASISGNAWRRLHHRAAGQPDVRRADRPVGHRDLDPHGPARAVPPGRDGAGRRHADERPAASGALEPSFLAAARCGWSRCRRRCARSRPRLGEAPRWVGRLDEVPGGAPMILVANELLDCLPARQFVRTESGWAERVIGLGEDGELLAFGLRRPGEVARRDAASPSRSQPRQRLGILAPPGRPRLRHRPSPRGPTAARRC